MVTHSAIKSLSDEELRSIIQSLRNVTWEEDHPIRQLAIDVYGDDTVIAMLGLAPDLAIELEERTRS